jgi:MoaA/NifB/PqqE/SkfB family radical SAM enzyme
MRGLTKAAFRAAFDNGIRGRPRPLILQLEPSENCNARCSFCYHWREQNEAEMSLPVVLRVLEEAWQMGCRLLYLSGGEPTIYPHAEATLARARALGYLSSMTTNGSRLTERLPDLAPYLDSVTVSIDHAGTRHDEVRGIHGLYQHAVEGLLTARRHLLNTRINMSLNADNMDQVVPLLELARDVGAGLHVRLLTRESEALDIQAFNGQEAAQAAHYLLSLKAQHPQILITPKIYFKTIARRGAFKCRPLSLLLTVDSVGRLFIPCPRWEGTKELTAGNVHSSSLEKAWASPLADSIRQEAAGCSPQVDCYTSCILDIALLANLDGAMVVEQLLTSNSLLRYFWHRGQP